MSNTIERRLEFLQKELSSIIEEVKLLRESSKLNLKFNHGQKVFLIKGNNTPNSLLNLISSENTQIEDIIEETSILQVCIGDGTFSAVGEAKVFYTVSRYYEYKKNFTEEELWYTKEELIESIRDKFEEAKSLWKERREQEKIRRQENLERELRKLKEEGI